MLAMLAWIADEAPSPISDIAMTAAMPMMIPRHVNAERSTLRRTACKAVRSVRKKNFIASILSRIGGRGDFYAAGWEAAPTAGGAFRFHNGSAKAISQIHGATHAAALERTNAAIGAVARRTMANLV